VTLHEQPGYLQTAVPVYDLTLKTARWGQDMIPEVFGWVRLARRPLDTDMFVAQVVGHSMEPGIPDGAWGLFRSFSARSQPSPMALDSRRVVASLQSGTDRETGAYTLKRWKVTKVSSGGEVVEVTLQPDNKALTPIVVMPANGRVPVVAEYLETVG
jgi:hypothetical protein